jgi:Neprosin
MRTKALTHVMLFMVAALSHGCIIQLGDGSPWASSSASSGESGEGAGSGTPGPKAAGLPEPTEWRVPSPRLTPEQQRRKQEVDAYLAQQYRGYPIVKAIQGFSGDVTYWVTSDALPVPALPALPWTATDLLPPDGAERARTELERFPELRGPLGTTPIHRPAFSAYIQGETGAASPQDYLEHGQVAGQPSGQQRLYAGLTLPQANRGASGTINPFAVDVEKGTFSLIEIAVACPTDGPMQEQIGVAISIDRANPFLDDGKPRLHVEFMTHGGATFGPRIGGWDEVQEGFVPYPGRPYGPGGVVTASAPGLLLQQEHRVDIFQAPNGDWYIAHNGNLLGHYPAGLFRMLNQGACRAAWYGEVFDPTPTDWTWTDMGSGRFAVDGYGYAAYVRDPMYLDLNYAPLYAQDDPTKPDRFSITPVDDHCYTRSQLPKFAPSWVRYLYLGGPGGDAAGCD